MLMGSISDARGAEPGILAHRDGALLVTFPGCRTGKSCENGPVYRSRDDGATWTYLNDPETGRLGAESHPANLDADLTSDAEGTLYASDFGSGIQVFRSHDGGDSWEWVSNPDEGADVDRQWMAAGPPQRLVMTWNGFFERTWTSRTSVDGGSTWTNTTRFGESIGTRSPPQFDASGTRVFSAYTQPRTPIPAAMGYDLLVQTEFQLVVVRSLDGGITWEAIDTGISLPKSTAGRHPFGTLLFPVLDITGDGHVVLVWSEEVVTPGNAWNLGARVRMSVSSNWGDTWSTPIDISRRPSAVMPWVSGGAGDRAVITYLAGDTMSDSDRGYLTEWDVLATVVDGVGSASVSMVEAVVERAVHRGSVCTTGTTCAASDRSLLDFFENDVMPDGRIVVAYAAKPITMTSGADDSTTEIRVAIQNGGSPMLVPG